MGVVGEAMSAAANESAPFGVGHLGRVAGGVRPRLVAAEVLVSLVPDVAGGIDDPGSGVLGGELVTFAH